MTKNHSLVAPGDSVVVSGYACLGEVVSVSGKYAVVAFQSLEVRISLVLLSKAASNHQFNAKNNSSVANILNANTDSFLTFNTEIDLHGMSVQEALSSTAQWIDRGFLLGHRQLKIIHGKGTGALRHAIRTYLKSHDQVKKILIRHAYPGGEGVTWLELQ